MAARAAAPGHAVRLTQGSVLDRAVDVVARLGIHGADQARERIRPAARRAGIGEPQLAEALLKLPRGGSPGRLVTWLRNNA